mmetsp:Transcript_9919/g.15966  ORF Transcript_9919/g.15966 Transcript_9919/m.15966 type:complete len:275 (+) Transcript_9919:604-1428(+)
MILQLLDVEVSPLILISYAGLLEGFLKLYQGLASGLTPVSLAFVLQHEQRSLGNALLHLFHLALVLLLALGSLAPGLFSFPTNLSRMRQLIPPVGLYMLFHRLPHLFARTFVEGHRRVHKLLLPLLFLAKACDDLVVCFTDFQCDRFCELWFRRIRVAQRAFRFEAGPLPNCPRLRLRFLLPWLAKFEGHRDCLLPLRCPFLCHLHPSPFVALVDFFKVGYPACTAALSNLGTFLIFNFFLQLLLRCLPGRLFFVLFLLLCQCALQHPRFESWR